MQTATYRTIRIDPSLLSQAAAHLPLEALGQVEVKEDEALKSRWRPIATRDDVKRKLSCETAKKQCSARKMACLEQVTKYWEVTAKQVWEAVKGQKLHSVTVQGYLREFVLSRELVAQSRAELIKGKVCYVNYYQLHPSKVQQVELEEEEFEAIAQNKPFLITKAQNNVEYLDLHCGERKIRAKVLGCDGHSNGLQGGYVALWLELWIGCPT